MMDELLELLKSLRRWHDYCEDPWYSCPKAEDGCADDNVPKDICTCGADEHNDRLDRAIAIAKELSDVYVAYCDVGHATHNKV